MARKRARIRKVRKKDNSPTPAFPKLWGRVWERGAGVPCNTVMGRDIMQEIIFTQHNVPTPRKYKTPGPRLGGRHETVGK